MNFIVISSAFHWHFIGRLLGVQTHFIGRDVPYMPFTKYVVVQTHFQSLHVDTTTNPRSIAKCRISTSRAPCNIHVFPNRERE